MLNSINLSDKSYEELLAEAVAQIPLYSKEWTNFNQSDPGITILQNLTAFGLLQQEAINEVSEEIKTKLLKLIGYTPKGNCAAKLLVQAPHDGGPILSVGHQLWSGSIPFETTENVELNPWGLSAVYAGTEDKLRDITRLLDENTDTFAYPFGREPEVGNGFICVISGIPEVGVPIHMWLSIAEEELRTPFDDETEIPVFSRLRWQYYTDEGWQDARFEDETIGLLCSGKVTLYLENGFPAVFEEAQTSGCAFRCILDEADYDRAPRLNYIAVHLFEMTQKNTSIQCITCRGAQTVNISGRLPKLGNIQVFCREEEDGPYRLYYRNDSAEADGRFYSAEENVWGTKLYFNMDSTFAPYTGNDAVRVICYDNEMIHHRVLGSVYGYDNQTIQIDLVENVLADSLLLMIEKEGRDGDYEYWFVSPDEAGHDGFKYHLKSKEAQIIIDEPGCGGCRLYIAHLATTEGALGNLRAGTVLEERGGYDGTDVEASYHSPAYGRGGVSQESAEDLRRRFSAGMQKTFVAVTAEDYETLVKRTPGLCIHKVRAVASGKDNLVKIAVKPHTEEMLSRLSDEYLSKIRAYLEPCRLVTTRYEICQPRYAQIGVKASISIRGMASYAQEEAEKLLKEALDYINGPQNFGEGVRFNEIYQKLISLPFVEAVDSLNLYPENRDATLVGSDISVGNDCLCYPGTVQLILRGVER